MIYLLYYLDGFIKKFPLRKSVITIGRKSADNDLVIRDETISRKHLEVIVKDNQVIIKDLGTTNGTFVNNARVKEAVIKVGESFTLGRMELVLQRGSLREFEPAKELISIFDRLSSENENKFKTTKTKYITDIYNEVLKQVLREGMKRSSFKDFVPHLSGLLSTLTFSGNLFLASQQEGELNILYSIKQKGNIMKVFKKIIEENPEIFSEDIEFRPAAKINGYFSSFPFKFNGRDAAIIYISNENQKEPEAKMGKFLLTLSKEFALLSQLFSESESKGEQRKEETGAAFPDDIIVGNHDMKELIKQTKKIAQSDIFVLIQGESGTGKELFARLIYNHSRRHKNEFVAINCAAIPESLLESELFGHEKGAFTSAYSQKKGKLEVASGGTLVLDEIGDMPMSLQSKLLRALQEQEFYRLGSTTSIKVDLRIISLTNQDLKELIRQNKFRQDLYFRLVHHTIHIPSLRERKEDISVLINYFTNQFCQQLNKNVSGYSIQACEALENYDWPGNVRQLENEINRIINLTDNGETVTFDILSDEIKHHQAEPGQAIEISSPRIAESESEKEFLVRMLEKNKWNKSLLARELGMTYQGLHKKLKRLGIARPEA